MIDVSSPADDWADDLSDEVLDRAPALTQCKGTLTTCFGKRAATTRAGSRPVT